MRKRIGMVLVLLMFLGSSVSAFAAATDSKELEQAIQAVKTIVEIPEEMTVFYSSKEAYITNSGQNVSVWHLEWSDEGGEAFIDATVDEDGNLLGFYRYHYDNDDRGKLAKISREEGQKAAEAFLKKALPQYADDMQAVDQDRDSYRSYAHHYTFQLSKNGVPIPEMQVDISVDRNLGYVRNYDGLLARIQLPSLPPVSNILSAEEAKDAYLKEYGIYLGYRYRSDDAGNTVAFPVYMSTNMYYDALDGKTGKSVNILDLATVYNLEYDYSAAKSYAEADAGGYWNYSDAEYEAIQGVSGLLTKSKAEEIAREKIGELSGMKLQVAYLEDDDWFDRDYTWELAFEGAYVYLDAETGELMSFRVHDENALKGSANFSYEEAKQIAAAFIQKEDGKRFEEVIAWEDAAVTVESGFYTQGDVYQINFARYHDGYVCFEDGFDIMVGKNSGKIVYYTKSWHENVVFSEINDAMTEAAAFDLFNAYGNLRLSYHFTDKNEMALVYKFEKDVPFFLDPVTGDRLDGLGALYKDGTIVEYTDISGHWAEKYITELANNGYYLEGETFLPNQKITQLEFLKYLSSFEAGYWGFDEAYFYKNLIRNGILDGDQNNPNAELTRQEAAKILIRYLGLELAGRQSEIYLNPFTDHPSDSYFGYAVLAKSLGILKGSKQGAFEGDRAMTRAEAASVIYNTLLVE